MKTSPEKFERKKEKTIRELFQENGRLDLYKISKEKAQILLEEFERSFLVLPSEERTQMFEEFLLKNAIPEDEAIVLAEKLEFDEREKFGEFIGNNIRPGLYAKLFHDQWYMLGRGLESQFIKKFTQDNPEAAIMIAPFVDLQNYSVPQKEEQTDNRKFTFSPPPPAWSRRSEARTSLIEKYFNNFESAKTLMEVCLRHPEDRGIKSTVDFFAEKNPLFLIPYFPQLIEKNVLTRERAKEILIGRGENNYRFYYFSGQFYMSPEEKHETKKLAGKVQNLWKKETEDDVLMDVGDWPDNLRMKFEDIETRAKKRGLKFVFQNFSAAIGFLTPEERLLFLGRTATEAETPILYVVKELELKPQDINIIMAEAEAAGEDLSLLDDLEDIKTLNESGMEDKSATILINQITNFENRYLAEKLVQRADSVLSWFSEKNKERIIKAINERAWDLWFHNTDFADKQKIVDIPKLILKAEKETYQFISNYRRIYYYVREAEKSGKETGYRLKDIPRAARAIFEKSPEKIFFNQKIFQELYPGPEQKEFIRKHLKSPTADFIDLALYELNKHNRTKEEDAEKQDTLDLTYAVKEMREAVKKNPQFFIGILEDDYRAWEILRHILPLEDRFKILFSHIHLAQVKDIIGRNDSLIKDLTEHPREMAQFLKILITQNDFLSMAALSGGLKHLLEKDKWARSPSIHFTEEEKRAVLHETTRKNIKLDYQKMIAFLVNACQDKKFLIFEKELLGLKDPEFNRFISRDIDEYINLHPEALNNIERYIEKDTYEQAIIKNTRAFAFMRSKYNDVIFDKKKVSGETMSYLYSLNPLLRLENQTTIEGDYYTLVLKELETNPFFKLYKNRLEKIAKEELRVNGPRTRMKAFVPNKEFYAIASRLFLLNSSPETVSQKEAIENMVAKDREELLAMLELSLLYNLDKNDEFKDAINNLSGNYEESRRTIETILARFARDLFELERKEDIKISLNDFTPEAFEALNIYYNNTLRKNQFAQKSFREFVEEALDGNYQNWRAWGARPTDIEEKQELFLKLQHEELLPHGLKLEQYENWTDTTKMAFEETLELSQKDIAAGIEKIFKQAVADQHVTEEELNKTLLGVKEKYDTANIPLLEWSSRLQELRMKIQEAKTSGQKYALSPEEETEYKGLQKKIADYKSENGALLLELEAGLYLSRLKSPALNDLENKTISVSGKSIGFSKIFQVLEDVFSESKPDFFQDILRIQSLLHEAQDQLFGGRRVSKSSLRLTDYIDLKTHVKIGEEPVGSCQSYLSTSDFNIGLFSCIVDPNVKIIQLYDENNRIIARSVMRLLEDDTGEPQLFLERIYSINAHHKIPEAMRSFAKQKAKTLGCGLYSHTQEGSDPETEIMEISNLHNKNSRAPYVYTDAGGGKIKNGKFTIKGAFRIG